jgi:hypothetical protein
MEEKRKSPTSKPAAILPDAFGRVQPYILTPFTVDKK